MFPGDTDPYFQENWDETTAGNTPSDRRFIQSAGPFTLEPGAVNYITTGVVWARAEQGGPLASVQKMKEADILAQALFDNCFDINYFVYGCTCDLASNYNEDANVDDGSCVYPDDLFIDCNNNCIYGDADGDNICTGIDNCPDDSNFSQSDSDSDEVGNACDNCVQTYNPDQADTDNDGIGDACEDVSLNENQDFKINIYPNPFSTEAIISIPPGTEEIKVFNSEGRCVREIKQSFGNNFIFNKENLSKGLYTFCFRIKGKIIDKKVILY
jgi:hypothetical protein